MHDVIMTVTVLVYGYLCCKNVSKRKAAIGEESGTQEQTARNCTDMPDLKNKRDKQKLEVPFRWFVILHLSLLLNSMAGVMSKFAGKSDFLSLKFFFFYGLVLVFTFLFALIWQQVLKNMSLTFAFTNKPITIIYALVWSVIIFGEHVTPKMVIGALVILAGIVIGVSGND